MYIPIYTYIFQYTYIIQIPALVVRRSNNEGNIIIIIQNTRVRSRQARGTGWGRSLGAVTVRRTRGASFKWRKRRRRVRGEGDRRRKTPVSSQIIKRVWSAALTRRSSSSSSNGRHTRPDTPDNDGTYIIYILYTRCTHTHTHTHSVHTNVCTHTFPRETSLHSSPCPSSAVRTPPLLPRNPRDRAPPGRVPQLARTAYSAASVDDRPSSSSLHVARGIIILYTRSCVYRRQAAAAVAGAGALRRPARPSRRCYII